MTFLEANLNVFQYTGREGTYTQDARTGAQWPDSVPGVYHYRSRDYLLFPPSPHLPLSHSLCVSAALREIKWLPSKRCVM